MAAAARLIGAILSNQPEEPKFIAKLSWGGDNCGCTIELADVMQTGLLQVTLTTRILEIAPKYAGLAHTSRYDADAQTYIVSFSLPNTPILEAAKFVRMLSDESLNAQYWFLTASGVMLGAIMEPEPHTIRFVTPKNDEHNAPEVWQRFAERLLSASDRCERIHAAADRVSVVLTAESWEKWEEVLPQLAALFPA